MSFSGRSRLLQNPPLQLPGATQAAADLSCSSNNSWGRGSVLLRRFKAAVCQPAKLAKPSPAAPRRHSGRGRPFLQLQQVPEAWGPGSVLLRTFKAAVCQPAKLAKRSLAAPRRHSGRGRPFLQLQTSPWGPGSVFLWTFKAAVCQPAKTPQNPPLQLPTQAAADLSCSSNKFLRPWQCPFKDVQGCRLPARKTRQTLPCSSQAPLRPRHSQAPLRPRQTFPAAPTSSWGPGSVLLRMFKAAVCQPAKLAKRSPAAPRRHSGRGRPFLQLQQVPEALAVSF